MYMNLTKNLNEYKNISERFLKLYFDNLKTEEGLLKAMRYAVENGGKRLRPAVMYMAAKFVGGSIDTVIQLSNAIELIHSYSLVHDDLPCMDDDVLRRGKPTCHIAFGEDVAILAGDALLNAAYEILLEESAKGERFVAAAKYISRAAGAAGMVGGQYLDIKGAENVAELNRIYYLKTTMLLKSSILAGAAACGADAKKMDALNLYSNNIGLMFQIVDDIMDVEGSADEIGKSIGKDEKSGKKTYVGLYGIEFCKNRVEELCRNAESALAEFSGSEELIEFSRYLATRRN